jgi:hypothetical protein
MDVLWDHVHWWILVLMVDEAPLSVSVVSENEGKAILSVFVRCGSNYLYAIMKGSSF